VTNFSPKTDFFGSRENLPLIERWTLVGPPFALRALPRSIATSAPLRRIGTFGLAVGAACTFSVGIAGQVLTFHTGARSRFAPPTCRMPLEQSQAFPKLIPKDGPPLGFDIV